MFSKVTLPRGSSSPLVEDGHSYAHFVAVVFGLAVLLVRTVLSMDLPMGRKAVVEQLEFSLENRVVNWWVMDVSFLVPRSSLLS